MKRGASDPRRAFPKLPILIHPVLLFRPLPFNSSVLCAKSAFLVPKLHLGTHLSAKLRFPYFSFPSAALTASKFGKSFGVAVCST